MSKIERFIFIFLITFAVYHTIRDVFQIMNVHHWLIDIANQKTNWCKAIYPVCDYYTIPWEIFVIVGSTIVLKRNLVSLLGRFVLLSCAIWPIIWIFNWVFT